MNRRAVAGLFLACSVMGTAGPAFGKSDMSVQVKSGQIRATPSYLGQVKATLDYGVRVRVLQQKGDWMEVEASGTPRGWIHASALTAKRIVMRAGDQDVSARTSGEELALAGKGFNQEVEAAFKDKNPSIDFKWVDWMEKTSYSMDELTAFLREGGVSGRGGGAP